MAFFVKHSKGNWIAPEILVHEKINQFEEKNLHKTSCSNHKVSEHCLFDDQQLSNI